ncbi:hypothetical protein LCH33_002834 [Pseudomonas amygdali]|uniref:ABC transporter permease n=1 Tax=Pseudomonas amygdali pv. hibisci TaxID=251723 RepID=A0AB34U866_PSEA0|nr:hypothetical protein [Pseudomonas amygdali]KPX55570.1 hypothetical protein ALO67_200020 [Pseudomonas amygdali pv. hibisci]UBT79443.1 hypothetical protein LCH33_002834 [Pseudomonas amygdali]
MIKHFYLETPLHLLMKLKWGINRFNECVEINEPGQQFFPAVYYAFDCGVTAWSMVDWVWKYHNSEIVKRFGPKRNDFAEWVRQSSDHLRICYQLATSAKHRGVDNFADHGLRTGVEWLPEEPFSAGSTAGSPMVRHRYYFSMDDSGTKRQVGEVLEGAYLFWCQELRIPPIVE